MSSADRVKMEPAWKAALLDQFDAPYMQQLRSFLIDEIKAGQTIYPPGAQYFEAYNVTPLDKVKVVILGQDPYHGPGQAQFIDHPMDHLHLAGTGSCRRHPRIRQGERNCDRHV